MAKLKAAFQDPLAMGPSEALTKALHAAFFGKLRGIAIELAVASATPLPFSSLLELATVPRAPSDAELLGRAIAMHATDAALVAIFEVFETTAPAEFWSSGAAIGHALRWSSHPATTGRLRDLAKQATPDRLAMIAWTLARRPRSEEIATFAKRLFDPTALLPNGAAGRARVLSVAAEPVLGGFLMFAHADDRELVPVIQRMLQGEIRIGGAITIADRGPGIAQMKSAQDVAVGSRIDAISAYFAATVRAALAGNRAARVRIGQFSNWLASMSTARLPPSRGWMPALATLIATADAKLAGTAIDLFKLLAMPAADADAVLRAIVLRSPDLGVILDAKLTPKILAKATHHLDLELLSRVARPAQAIV